MASATKQSTSPLHVGPAFDLGKLDGFASLAMTGSAASDACKP
jgi:hypothetical protein